jgi:hypothetical protein
MCNLCSSVLTSQDLSSTSFCLKHLRRKHATKVAEFNTEKKEKTIQTKLDFVIPPISNTVKKSLDKLLLHFIIKDMQPFGIVESERYSVLTLCLMLYMI